MASNTISSQVKKGSCTWDGSLSDIAPSLRPEDAKQQATLNVLFKGSKHNSADLVYSIHFEGHRWRADIQHRRSMLNFCTSSKVKKEIEATLFQQWKPIRHMDAEEGFSYCRFFKGETISSEPRIPPQTSTTSDPSVLQDLDDALDEFLIVSRPLLPQDNTTDSQATTREAIAKASNLVPFSDYYPAIEKWVTEFNLRHCKVSHRVEIEQKYLLNAMQQIRKHGLPYADAQIVLVPVTLTDRGRFKGLHAVLAVITEERIFIVDPKHHEYPSPLHSLSTGFQPCYNRGDCTRYTMYTLKSLLPKLEQHCINQTQASEVGILLTERQLRNYLVTIPPLNRKQINQLLAEDSGVIKRERR
ncbi:hypothetical protein D5018_12825 [Parashewanella curva]|uniref:Uncharacterized protein n=1 Tax=Parashewanella curva TaxID=2338552 RepID=A0A3L8PXD5_9GAMM|nr:hypothetical protein [Parashewanella curva]RLV59293.1 hypothetical protein D5018_12825 [Parashewanella curva]